MSSNVCFICYKEATCDTDDEIKERYKDIVGINTLCPEDECFRNQFDSKNNEYYYEYNENKDIIDHISNQDVNNDPIYSVNTVTNSNLSEHNDLIVNDSSQNNDAILNNVKKKKKSKKKKNFNVIVLSLEEQKAELEKNRKKKKYIEAEFKCYNCALPFLFKDTYQAHMMRHEESNGEFRCEICTLRFASARVLRSHAALHATRRVHAGHATHDSHATRATPADARACHLCGAVFRKASGLQQHLKRYHQANTSKRNYSCSVCGKNYANQAAVRTHMITHIRRKFSCDQCSSVFSSPYTLTQHKKKHDPGEQSMFFCETCGVSYSSKKSLLAHRRNSINHQQSVPECPVCGKICPNQHSLSRHIASMHSSSKDYWCPRCPARYTTRKSLIRHMKAHDEPEQYQMAVCHLCGLGFKGKSKLNRHLREVCEKQKLEEELSSYYDQEEIVQ
ncbi:zinc finger Y-chromosomal protein [Aphomia sociella]